MNLFSNESILTFTLRVILGILFFFQGYDKVFKVKMDNVINTFKMELGNLKLPNFLMVISAYYTSYIEFLAGLLLIVGLFTNYALLLLGVDLILVVGAFSLINPVWDMKFVFQRLLIWAILMEIPEQYNKFSIDFLLK